MWLVSSKLNKNLFLLFHVAQSFVISLRFTVSAFSFTNSKSQKEFFKVQFNLLKVRTDTLMYKQVFTG